MQAPVTAAHLLGRPTAVPAADADSDPPGHQARVSRSVQSGIGLLAPPGFPAETLRHFRGATVGIQAVMWTAIGLIFGGGAQRVMARRAAHRSTGDHTVR